MKRGTALARELSYYRKNKNKLLAKYEGQFVVVSGDEVIAPYPDEAEAYKAALHRWGNRPFLIRRVAREDPEIHVPVLVAGLNRRADP